MTDDGSHGGDAPGGPDSGPPSGPERGTVSLPERVDLPRLLDFYDYQDAENTRVAEFYDNLRDGDLTTTGCETCGATHFPPRVVCPECHSEDLAYVPLPHQGTIYAFTAVRGTHPIGMSGADADRDTGESEDRDTDSEEESREPFVAAVVDLGPVRLSARIDGATHETVEIGDPVTLKIVDVDGPTDRERVFYRFVPVGTGGDR